MVKLEFEKVWFLFEERRKPEYPGKKLSEQRREPATHSTHMWHQHQDLKPAILVGGECSHHCATLALLPLLQFIFYFPFWLFITPSNKLATDEHPWNLRKVVSSFMLACKQALLFGQAKQAARECTSERSPLRVYFLRYPQMESLLAGYTRLWRDTSYNKWFIKIK